MDIRLIAADLDGTLLSGGGEIPPINVRALLECARRGIFVAFSSGRSFEAMAKIARKAGLNPILSSANGARIDLSPAGETICESPMEPKTSWAVYEVLMAAGVYFMAYARGRSYMGNSEARLGTNKLLHQPGRYDYGGHPYEVVDDPGRMEAEGTASPYKYVVFGKDYDPAFDHLRRALAGRGLSISSSWRDNLEIMAPGVHKGASLKRIAEGFGIPRAAVMAFGDNTNDIPMFEYAGHPVAMAGAEKSTLSKARYVAEDCDSGGVGKMIEELLLK